MTIINLELYDDIEAAIGALDSLQPVSVKIDFEKSFYRNKDNLKKFLLNYFEANWTTIIDAMRNDMIADLVSIKSAASTEVDDLKVIVDSKDPDKHKKNKESK